MMAVLAHVLHRSPPMNCCRIGALLEATTRVVVGSAQDTIMNVACVKVRSASQGATVGVAFGAALGCSLGTACGAAAAAAA